MCSSSGRSSWHSMQLEYRPAVLHGNAPDQHMSCYLLFDGFLRLCCTGCAAVFKFLLAQKDLGLSDLTAVNLTVADVRISYVHGIWYEVSLPCIGSQALVEQ